MKIRKYTNNLFFLALLTSCSLPSENVINNKDERVIRGIIDFPKNNFIQKYSTKAELNQIGIKATVSLIYPPNDELNPNVTIATGLSDTNGSFYINTEFNPTVNKVYILEASKRIGSSGSDLISVRTYIKWTGSNWQSITTPNLNINSTTTAITIIDFYDDSISPNDTINSVNNGLSSPITSVSTQIIKNVSDIVQGVLLNDRDPVKFISYKNNKYFINKESSVNKDYLLSYKNCPNCELTYEDLSNQNLSNADLTNSNFSYSNLSNTNLSNSNLSNANITGANLAKTNLSNVKWINGTTICGENSFGQCLFPDIKVNTYTTNKQELPKVAMDSVGNFVVTWQSENQFNSNSALDIYAQRYNSVGIPQGSEFKVNSYTTNNQKDPSIAMDSSGNFIIVWTSNNQTNSNFGDDIYGQKYNSLGIPQGSEFRISTTSTNSRSRPIVAMGSVGNFVVVWNSVIGTYNNIYAKRYNNGSPYFSDFKINSSTTTEQYLPSVSMNSDNKFIVTWSSFEQNSSSYDIHAKRYSSDGTVFADRPIQCIQPECDISTGEFRVNLYTTNNQNNSSVMMDSVGNFIVTWDSFNQNGSDSSYDIYSRRYNSVGMALESPMKVNSYTSGEQSHPSVITDQTGHYIISWLGNNNEDSNGIYLKRFHREGLKEYSEYRINNYTTSIQNNHSIVNDNNGYFVVLWQSLNQSGVSSNSDIYLKRYSSNELAQ